MSYVLGEPTVQQYFDSSGDPLVNGTIEFYLSGTTTPTSIYSDSAGTAIGTSVTLNSSGAPANSGTAVALFFDTAITYKIVRKDASGIEIAPTLDPYNVPNPSNGQISVKDYGAVGDGATDDYAALQTAINAAQGVGVLWLPPGEYLTSQTLIITSPIVILGSGGADNDGLSDIVGDNVDGPVIRVKTAHYTFKDFTVTASNTRRVAQRIIGSNYSSLGKARDDQNYGIWVEADDLSAQEIGDGFMQNIWVHNQPNDGVMLVGRIYGSLLLKCGVRDSIGHGFVINCGDETGRTNTDPPGVISLDTLQVYGCTGHALAVGSENVTQIAVRCIVDNFDAYNCCSDSTITYNQGSNPYMIHYFCDNGIIRDSAVNGNNDTIGGIRVAGRNTALTNNRYLDTLQPVYIDRLQLSSADRVSDGIEVDGIHTTQDTALVHSAAVAVHSSSINCTARALTVDGNFINVAAAGGPVIEIQKNDDRVWEGTLAVDQSVTAAQVYSGFVTVADDAVATINTRISAGYITITTDANTTTPDDTRRIFAYYNTGTTPSVTSINEGSNSSVVSTDVVGTTGVDGEITLGVVVDNVKIENRSGASAVFFYAFLG